MRPAPAHRIVLASVAVLVLGALATSAPAKEAGTNEHVAGESSGRLLTSPARQLASVAPGGRTSFPMIVQNRLGRTATIEVEALDLAPGKDSYSELVKAGSEGRGAGEWLTPEAGTFVLEDGERKTFDVQVAVPPTAGPGGHFGAIAVQVRPEQADDTRLGVGIRIATNVTVLVPGAVVYDGRASHVHLARSGDDHLRVAFDATATGNIQTRPTATITVDGPFGHTTTKRLELPELLPGGTRHVSTRVDRPDGVGTARASVRLRFEDRSHSKRARSNTIRLLPPTSWLATGVAGLLVLVVALELVRRHRLRRLLELYGDDTNEEHEPIATDDEPSED